MIFYVNKNLCSMDAFRDSGAGARLGNFWKRWVPVQRDSAIKKLLKIFWFIFLYIFTIKIFLKNTLLCLDSQKKERRQVLAIPAIFKANFGRFRHVSAVSAAGWYYLIWWIWPDFGQISPVRRESKPHRHESSRNVANRAASARIREKKKKSRRGPTRGQSRRTLRPSSLRVGRGCGTSGAASVLSRK